MPAIGYSYNLLQGLSAFWQRFFADADQLQALYKGTAVLIGQAYLDYLSTVLGVSLQDCIALDRELFQMLTIREDEIAFVEGNVIANNRWSFTLPSPVVSFASIDNQVVEPTASLEPNIDFELPSDGTVLFHEDPTNPTGNGVPLDGYARRQVDAAVGGQFTDTAVTDWTTSGVAKGDTLRLLNVGTNGLQRKQGDFTIVVVRTPALFTTSAAPLPPPATGVKYVILRVPSNNTVVAESDAIVGGMLTLGHTRVDQGSLRIFAQGPTGADVVEGTDYVVNYEGGTVTVLTAWQGTPGPYGVSYTWRKEVFPTTGASPRLASTGVIVAQSVPGIPLTTPVVEIAAWAPDALVDRMTLANNFGSLIGNVQPSSEAYRAFLRGIFQLYVLGPVLNRVESALNVVMNLPVVNTDGEIYQATDESDPNVWRIYTKSSGSGIINTYNFPVNTPLRTDLVAGDVLAAFDVLTTAVTVTDYVQTPSWWYGQVIPKELFSGTVPPIDRRTASPVFVQHVCNPDDGALCGDPGLVCGADEDGHIPTPRGGNPPLRHRLAFVLMERYLKFHTFSVTFNAAALSAIATSAAAFAQSLDNLNDLVLSAKPSHTYAFTTPGTFFEDDVEVNEANISFDRLVGSRVFGPDEVIFTDAPIASGSGVWFSGDYFHYEVFTSSVAFPALSTPVTMPHAPSAPRRRRLFHADMSAGNIGGKALVENVDYSVDYVNCTVTRLTAWAATTINVTFRQLNIGNLTNGPVGAGDMPLLSGGIDPAVFTAAFSASAAGWDGTVEPPTAPRDIGLVENPLIVFPH